MCVQSMLPSVIMHSYDWMHGLAIGSSAIMVTIN